MSTYEGYTYDDYNDVSIDHTLSSSPGRYLLAIGGCINAGGSAETKAAEYSNVTYDGSQMIKAVSANSGFTNCQSDSCIFYTAVPGADTGAKTVVASGGVLEVVHRLLAVVEISYATGIGDTAGNATNAAELTGVASTSLCVAFSRKDTNADAAVTDGSATEIFKGNYNDSDSRFDNGWGASYHSFSGTFEFTFTEDLPQSTVAIEVLGGGVGGAHWWFFANEFYKDLKYGILNGEELVRRWKKLWDPRPQIESVMLCRGPQ